MNQQPAGNANPVRRVRTWYTLLVLVFGLFVVRAFYLQVINHDYYKKAALSDQLKQYEVPAERGTIMGYLGGSSVPLVMNQKLYTLYADPSITGNTKTVGDVGKAAGQLQRVIGGTSDDIEASLKKEHSRYVILKRKLTPAQSDKVLALKIPGVGTQEQSYRTYPQGTLASQTLGFVNDEGTGKYGVEQALNKELNGKTGQLKAVTDINGVPLAASSTNLSVEPVPGKNVQLTLDLGMQSRLEKLLQAAQQKNQSKSVSAVIMDVHTGAVKAMANYPTYDPADYQHVEDGTLFQNNATAEAIEPGSITKVFTTAAALQKGVITPSTSFYDPGSWPIDGAKVTDVEQDHSTGQQTVLSTLDKSLNTGATWMLMQLGGGQLNGQGRNALYDYFTNHFGIGQETGIEQGYESSGFMPKPANTGSGINLTYANISFGQGYSATALQMAAGFSSIVNGGTYYQPRLVDGTVGGDGKLQAAKPIVARQDVVSQKVSDQMISLLEQNNDNHVRDGFKYLNFGPNYSVGGKTGTAEIADPNGGYYPQDRVNGTYLGFIGGDHPQYAIAVYNIEPKKFGGFAGAGTGQPLFADIAHMLVDSFGVTPRSQ